MVRRFVLGVTGLFLLVLQNPLTLTPSAAPSGPCWGVFVTQADGTWCFAEKFKFQSVEDAVRYADRWTLRGQDFDGQSISSEWIEDDPEMDYLPWPEEDVIYRRFVLAANTEDLMTGDLDPSRLLIYIRPIDPTLYYGEIF